MTTNPTTPEMLELLTRAVSATARLVANVEPDRWTNPSPCEDMDAHQLVEHIVGGLHQFAEVGAGRVFDEITFERSFPTDVAAKAYDEAGQHMVSVWSEPGVADKPYAMPWGETPGTALLGFMVVEQVVHGWDLARATGQTADDGELAEATLQLARSYDDETIRVPGMFGAIVAIDGDAAPSDRLAAFLGRHPDWQPDASERASAAMNGFEIVEQPEQIAVVMEGEVPIDQLPEFFGKAFNASMAAIESAGASVTGPPIGFYPRTPTDTVTVAAGFPATAPVETPNVTTIELARGPAVVGVHVGPYDKLVDTYQSLDAWVAEQGIEVAVGMWECYLSDPEAEPDPSTWRTQIVWPLRNGGSS